MGVHSEVQVMRISILDLVFGDSYSWKLVGIIYTVIQFMPVLAILNHGSRMLPNPVSVVPDLG
jgi:hypothetical protein